MATLSKKPSFITFLMRTVSAVCITASMLLSASAQSVPPNFPDPKNATPDQDGIYNVVEHLPSFPGGTNEFISYLANSIKYPAADRQKNIQGRVVAQFVVEPDGSLTNIKIIRSPSDDMSKETERVLGLSPKWEPGMQKGVAVRSRYTVPLSFTLGKIFKD
jgi:TonB family protein